MSTIPPPGPPPPPPPPVLINLESPSRSQEVEENPSRFVNVDTCRWAIEHPELREACSRNKICEYEAPFQYSYKYVEFIYQIGPTCGLAALSMLVDGIVTPEELLDIAKKEGFSNNGEMFSCKNMMSLASIMLSLAEVENVRHSLKKGGLQREGTVHRLLEGAVLLVPYDADFNHSPCKRNGHTAHWAVVCGIIVVKDPDTNKDPNNIFVVCKHGRSKYLAVWSLEELAKSNKNLWEFSPKRAADGLLYILPAGGIGGEDGIRNQYLMFEGL